jgi:hypothetical protein
MTLGPRFYRLNRKRVIEKEARNAGFTQVEVRMWQCEPNYVGFHPIAFVPGVACERIVNRYSILAGLRAIIFARLVK